MSYPHMAIPHLKAVVNGFYMTDGGSIDLRILDDAGLEHSLELVQHLIPENSTADRRFGRLYLDDRLIDIRSVDEAAIITFLETAAIQVPYAKSSPAERRHVIIGIDISCFRCERQGTCIRPWFLSEAITQLRGIGRVRSPRQFCSKWRLTYSKNTRNHFAACGGPQPVRRSSLVSRGSSLRCC